MALLTVSNNGRGKRYEQEFQKEAVRLLDTGRPAAQLARELGVSTWSLGQWKKRHGAGRAESAPVGRSPKGSAEGGASAVALADQVARLQAELRTVTRQREIFKKALAILSQDLSLSLT
jgi:transposase